jgi:NAD(P)-dependent dehydrogenase (short-subunit alcohol dehydrogenase family)
MSKLALVTGASSGIGEPFARRLATSGDDLVAVGGRLDRLQELASSLANVNVRPLAEDLSTDEGIDAVAEVCASQPLTMRVAEPHRSPDVPAAHWKIERQLADGLKCRRSIARRSSRVGGQTATVAACKPTKP